MRKRYTQYNVPMSESDDERLHKVAGPGNLGRFIRAAILRAIEEVEAEQADDDVGDDAPRRIFE